MLPMSNREMEFPLRQKQLILSIWKFVVRHLKSNMQISVALENITARWYAPRSSESKIFIDLFSIQLL